MCIYNKDKKMSEVKEGLILISIMLFGLFCFVIGLHTGEEEGSKRFYYKNDYI